ncbi:MAG: hypothetical protein ABSF52_08785 [Syntrophobacteraceae bacterium]
MRNTSVYVIVVLLTVIFACGKVGALDCDSQEVKSRVVAGYAAKVRDYLADGLVHSMKGNIAAGDTGLNVFVVKGYENLKAAADKSYSTPSAQSGQKWIKEQFAILEDMLSKLTLTEIKTISKDDGKKKCDCEGVVKGDEHFEAVKQKYSVQQTSAGLSVDLVLGEGPFQTRPNK